MNNSNKEKMSLEQRIKSIGINTALSTISGSALAWDVVSILRKGTELNALSVVSAAGSAGFLYYFGSKVYNHYKHSLEDYG